MDEGDPFESIASSGSVIELEDDVAKLDKRLIRLMEREDYLASQGITCEIKDNASTSCWACPVFQAGEEGLAALCRVGRQQERLATQAVIVRRSAEDK